jgi:hypothetical protein
MLLNLYGSNNNHSYVQPSQSIEQHVYVRSMSSVANLLTYLLTYLLTPWSRVLLQNLTGFQLVKKFPAFDGTRRFITAFTSARHLSLT